MNDLISLTAKHTSCFAGEMTDAQMWYYADLGDTAGPVDAAGIRDLIRQGIVTSSTWILIEGTEDWMLVQNSPFNEHVVNALPAPEEHNRHFDDPAPVSVRDVQHLPTETVLTKLTQQEIEGQPSEHNSSMNRKIVENLRRIYTAHSEGVIIVSIVAVVLCCVIVGNAISKKHPHHVIIIDNPEQQFLQFQTMVDGMKAPAADAVGQLKSGMTTAEAMAVLNSAEITDSFGDSLQYKQLLKEHVFDKTLKTGDTLKSIVLKRPSELPLEIACVALAFFNDGLYRVTYIYDQQEIMTIVPKEQKYAGSGDKWEVEKRKKSWDDLVDRTVEAVSKKYTPVTLAFVNFFRDSSSPEVIGPSGGSERVLFHGVSTAAVAHISNITQDESKIGYLDPDSTVTTYYEKRVIIADFLFIDFARKYGLNYYHSNLQATEKQADKDRAYHDAFVQKVHDDEQKEAEAAQQEEKRKAEQLGKGF